MCAKTKIPYTRVFRFAKKKEKKRKKEKWDFAVDM